MKIIAKTIERGQALAGELDVVANNLANVNTTGFKADHPLFEEYLNSGAHEDNFARPDRPVSYVQDRGTFRDYAQGSAQLTSNPLDVAINGAGFFQILLPDGTTAYTRDGSFALMGSTSNRGLFALMAKKEFSDPKQLKGKKVAANTSAQITMNGLLAETDKLVKATVAGQLATRGDAGQFAGGWGQLVGGVNDLCDAFVRPINVTAEYVDRISKGDIPPKITDTYHGDFNEIKNNLNICIHSVNALVTDANILSQAALQGRLSIRADASRHRLRIPAPCGSALRRSDHCFRSADGMALLGAVWGAAGGDWWRGHRAALVSRRLRIARVGVWNGRDHAWVAPVADNGLARSTRVGAGASGESESCRDFGCAQLVGALCGSRNARVFARRSRRVTRRERARGATAGGN